MRLGDLVFTRYDGQVSHVGVYAGDNTVWGARRSGTASMRQHIWTNDILVDRVGSSGVL